MTLEFDIGQPLTSAEPLSKSPRAPFLVGIGGATKPVSSPERALRLVMNAAQEAGARTAIFDGAFLASLPLYTPETRVRTAEEAALLEAVRKADGLVIACPAYHGGVSALVKNAIDLLEETAKDARCYLDGLPVGLVVTAYGWQATGTTLQALRSIVHALRGWPTPLGVTINCGQGQIFGADGRCLEESVARQLALVASQVVKFAALQPLC